MADKSTFKNVDFDVVRIRFETSGSVENMRLFRNQHDVLNGPEGETFLYAWKAVDEPITPAELDTFGASGVYGRAYNFGNLEGRVG